MPTRNELSAEAVHDFVARGFVRIEGAVSPQLAAQCRSLLWQQMGLSPESPAEWVEPVVRLGYLSDAPFVEAVNAPKLLRAFDQLLGKGHWFPRSDLGTFVVRFPIDTPVSDDGWHVDASFPGDDPTNFFGYRVNVQSRGRGLLMLFLLSDVGELDAPTRLRAGSHFDVARLLARAPPDTGMAFMELASQLSVTEGRPEALATGKAGDVYLCHPFLAHAAQAHRGTEPRFLAQPPLHLKALQLERDDGEYSPVEQAIRHALT